MATDADYGLQFDSKSIGYPNNVRVTLPLIWYPRGLDERKFVVYNILLAVRCRCQNAER